MPITAQLGDCAVFYIREVTVRTDNDKLHR